MNIEQKTITSMEVAEMMEVNHWEILRKLEGTDRIVGIIPTMTDNKIVVSDYFTESTYIDASGKANKCYDISRLGCDFLANKFTGEKGIIFTAKYVKRFHDMEKQLQAPTSYLEILKNATLEVSQKIDSVDNDLQTFKQDMPILGIEESKITAAVRKKGVHCLGGKQSAAYQDRPIRGKVYSDIYGQLKRQFGVDTYKAIKRSQCDTAVSVIEGYELPLVLAEEIHDTNAQMDLDI